MNLREHVKEIEEKYQAGQNLFRRNSVGFLLERISQLEQSAQHRLAADVKPAKPLFTYKWHCLECGKWHSDKEFTCPRLSHAAKA